MIHEDLISLIISPSGLSWLPALKIAVIVLSLIWIAIILILASFKTSWLQVRFLFDIFEFFTYRPYGTKKLAKQWTKTMARLETGLESEYKLAVIEADSLFADVVEKMGYSGEGLEEKLEKISKDILPNVEETLSAHQIRNSIVHDPDYRLGLDEARRALAIYEKSLIDLGAL